MPRKSRRGRRGATTIDPPPSGATPPTTPTALSFSEHGGIAEPGNIDLEEWWIDVLKGAEPLPPLEQQVAMARWWQTHVGYDGPTVAAWLAARGIGTTTSTMVVATPELGSALDTLARGSVSPELISVPTATLQAFERDQYGVLGPVVADDKEIGTRVPLVQPRLAASAPRGWLAGTSVAALLFGGLFGFMAQGTETSQLPAPLLVAPSVAPPVPPPPPPPLPPLLITRWEKDGDVVRIEGDNCSAPAQAGISKAAHFDGLEFQRSNPPAYDLWQMTDASGVPSTTTNSTDSEVRFDFPEKGREVAGGTLRTSRYEILTFEGTTFTGVGVQTIRFFGTFGGTNLDGQVCIVTFDITGSTDVPVDDAAVASLIAAS